MCWPKGLSSVLAGGVVKKEANNEEFWIFIYFWLDHRSIDCVSV